MCLDSIKILKKRAKAMKLGTEETSELKRSGKQYRYKARGTRTSQLVNKAVSSFSCAN